ncbi:DDE transposase [Bacillus cereus]|uniref:Tn3 family transposase n=1 Tax=Bacillus nitratireducens TaxID=2026193 RepID=UPI000BFC16EF|nr:Tn3 family transposase [Bacillus nitratireducens]MED0906624.1 Tn3 family transposase [Bacillus nitratireducens]PGM40074.1 DDE transposase [Bacillus cereus]
MNTQKRLTILTIDEINQIYSRPLFTTKERVQYFSLSQMENELLYTLRSIKSKIYFILQLGYFKSKHLFFRFDLCEVEEDIQYILKVHFNGAEFSDFGSIDKKTRLNQQQLILKRFNYRLCDSQSRLDLKEQARRAATVSGKPIFIFRELINYLTNKRIVIPGYSFMQEVVGNAITYEQQRLIMIIQNQLSETDKQHLKELLYNSSGLYEITRIKHEPKDFSMNEIKREIECGKDIHSFFQMANTILPQLKISNESIKYYASLVEYYSVYKLKRFDESLIYIYLLCFIFHRYQRMNDNLINSFIYKMRKYNDDILSFAKEQVYTYYTENQGDFKKVGEVLQVIVDKNIADNTAFKDIQERVFSILDRPKLTELANQILDNTKIDEKAFRWERIDTLALQFKRQIRPIFMMVDFVTTGTDNSLMNAITFLKEVFTKGKTLTKYDIEDIPQVFITNSNKRYLYTKDESHSKRLLIDRYEFLIYYSLRHHLQSGDIFCRDSIQYRSFEDDLIDEDKWEQKEALIKDLHLTTLQQPIEQHLKELENRLETRITEINKKIISGKNKYIQLKKHESHNSWTLPYTRVSDPVNHSFFDVLPQIDMRSILYFVHQQCNFLDNFEHILGRYAKQNTNYNILVPCLIAWGTNMGLYRMGEVSDIDFSKLATTSANFIRLETLKDANDCISNATSQLPIVRYYNIDDFIHSSSDGQRFETQIHTLQSRHSSKYFGMNKGITSYTMVANHIPIQARIIGANEHESHYVFDILYNNTTDIKPNIHSTDTHGTNEVNFAILDLFGYQFAPRYKDIHATISRNLYGFQHSNQYEELLIKPLRKINKELIIKEWDNIQRIMLSLALKTTTQNVIVRKLSSYARKNQTKRALWEYDNIIKSLYFLEYIDSLSLRQNVQKALNRGESYHKLRRSVSYANFGKLRFKTEQDQHIWNECSRLLTNCIIYYNASILSNLLTKSQDKGIKMNILKYISPVAWQHINFYGRYEFSKSPTVVNLDAIIKNINEVDILNRLAREDSLEKE